MQRDLCAYLEDVATAHDKILEFISGLTFEQFASSELIVTAVERKLEIIGEALSQASKTFPGSVDSISDLRYAVMQRNRIAHGYFDIESSVLWKTIFDDLPALRLNIEALRIVRGC